MKHYEVFFRPQWVSLGEVDAVSDNHAIYLAVSYNGDLGLGYDAERDTITDALGDWAGVSDYLAVCME